MVAAKGRIVPKRVLSISYDVVLLNTRAMILEREGYTVTSAQTLRDAIALLQQDRFDAAIIGHSIPIEEQRQMSEAIRQQCPDAPVIALTRREGERLTFADRAIEAQRPEEMLDELRRLLRNGNGTG